MNFKDKPEESLLAFDVLIGIFSEGIDLKYDRLIEVVVVGFGLSQICFERDIIMNYFKEKWKVDIHI